MKYLSIWVVLVLSVLAACSSPRNSVGLLVYREDDLFMRSLVNDIQKESDGQFSLDTRFSLNSQVIQNEQIENLIREETQVLIINPVDRLGAYAVVKRLKMENIPVIFFNREPLRSDMELWDQVWYVGAKAEQSGRMQAELAMELFGSDPDSLNEFDRNDDGRIQTVILKGEQGHQDAEIRTAMVQTAFQEAGYSIDVIAVETANWNRNEAYETMEEILDRGVNPPELVLSNNDAMALGAISIMRQRGLFSDTNGNGKMERTDEEWIPVLGIDGVPESVEQIEAGYLYGTVHNDYSTMAKAIAALAESILEGRVDDDFPYEIIDGKYIWVDYKTFTLD
ncbi:MAG: galactose ABC transporter substrate-binding protein [Spirochaetaceae bacterium]|nr:galactose ABC transporter substrate-binding protein [Spirochaetaceae bacterium]MDT8298970.1 galactose ABC transporter substrate-binding protein [Spirochaetaceae bacterium]